MLQIDLSSLLKRLNQESHLALERAATLCIDQRGGEITVSHWFLSLLENPVGDLRTLLKLASLDTEKVKSALSSGFACQRESVNQYPSFSPLLIELIQEAWTLASVELGHESVRSGVLALAALLNPGRYLSLEAVHVFEPINREALRKEFNTLFAQTSENTKDENTETPLQGREETALAKYGQDITAQVRAGKVDPVLCRDAEIDQMIDVLTRRRKNNPIIVGEAGVGKSALVEGLAIRIAEGRTPQTLSDVSLWRLDLGALQAGAAVKGEFEKRLKAVIDEVKNAARPIILFIDEAHTLIGAGNAAGGSDAANLLKPALARGELRTIAATTWSEYKKYFEKDAALTRRFQLIKLAEPSIKQTVHILRGLRPSYENAHRVYITDEAIHAAAAMSARYLSGRQLPDKAIDVLDTASARVATALAEPPRKLSALKNEYNQTQAEIEHLLRDERLGKAVDADRLKALHEKLADIKKQKQHLTQMWGAQKSLIEEILALREVVEGRAGESEPTPKEKGDDEKAVENLAQNSQEKAKGSAHVGAAAPDINEANKTEQSTLKTGKQPSEKEIKESLQLLKKKVVELEELQKSEALLHADVGTEQIAQVIADWTGIPATTISVDQMERLRNMPTIMHKRVKGQGDGISHIHRHLLTATADLRRPGTPLGAFLLVGPSGVGKTEAARVIADEFFGGLQFLTTLNMSEYQEKHTVSRLLGSPPGYVGYGEGGVLTEAIRKKPYSVVLLDEVEKAHPEVLNIFYQAFDKGEVADGEGLVIDCKNILFFMTSNIGFDTVEGSTRDADQTELREKLMGFFKPALLARMQVVPFNHLDEEVLGEIVDMRLSAIKKQFNERYKADLLIQENVIEELKSRCVRHENGARMLDASLDGELLPPLSLAVLERLAKNEPFTQVKLSWVDDAFVAKVQE